MANTSDLSDQIIIIQCYTCDRVSIGGVWARQEVPEKYRDDVVKDYCPRCDEAQKSLMAYYNRRPKRKIIGIPTIAI